MSYDLVIKNGALIDGSGLPRYRADVGVRHGRVAAIGRIRERADEVIDADGLVVSCRRSPTICRPARGGWCSARGIARRS
jgi:predicted amidohydrolase